MKITVVCISCTEDSEDEEHIEMIIEGNLYFNPETKSQAQHYKCPKCLHEVSVVVEIKQ